MLNSAEVRIIILMFASTVRRYWTDWTSNSFECWFYVNAVYLRLHTFSLSSNTRAVWAQINRPAQRCTLLKHCAVDESVKSEINIHAIARWNDDDDTHTTTTIINTTTTTQSSSHRSATYILPKPKGTNQQIFYFWLCQHIKSAWRCAHVQFYYFVILKISLLMRSTLLLALQFSCNLAVCRIFCLVSLAIFLSFCTWTFSS